MIMTFLAMAVLQEGVLASACATVLPTARFFLATVHTRVPGRVARFTRSYNTAILGF